MLPGGDKVVPEYHGMEQMSKIVHIDLKPATVLFCVAACLEKWRVFVLGV